MLSSFRLAWLLLCTCSVFSIPQTQAQEYPSKPIRIIVPNNPGVTPDILLRLITPGMSKFIGQPIVIENKSGADGVIAYEYVAKQVPADGYTVMLGSASQLAILPWITQDLRFNPLKDLVPVIGLAKSRYVFASTSKLPWKSFAEMLSYARANPGKLNYGSSGATTHLLSESIIRNLGLSITYVPYRAGAAYQQAMVANEVQVGLLSESSAIAQGDKVQPLAITGDARSPAFPAIPTFAELGQPRLPGTSYELSVPAATPQGVISRLFGAALQAVQEPEVRARLDKLGFEVMGEPPDASLERLAQEGRLFADIAKAVGVKP